MSLQPHTPLMMALIGGRVSMLRLILDGGMPDVQDWIDRSDPNMGITPLMATTFRDCDEDEALTIAKMLVEAGANVETSDGGEGSFPLFQAANQGKAKLVRYFLSLGADVARTVPDGKTSVWIAAYSGFEHCVAALLNSAREEQEGSSGGGGGKHAFLLEATNSNGKTPCSAAVEYGHAACVGVLAKAGADLRRANPGLYATAGLDGDRDITYDPGPHTGQQYSLDMAVLSHVTLSCEGCGNFAENNETLQKCSRCILARYCSADCQRSSWPRHKKCCGKLKKGMKLYGDPKDSNIPEPQVSPFGFETEFTAVNTEYDGPSQCYDRDNHPVWEYSAGPRGASEWRRYPPDVEESLEGLFEGHAPKCMYKPGDPQAFGVYERHGRALNPPPHVATRYVSFDGLMTERELYTGATRLVRRNGKRIAERPNG